MFVHYSHILCKFHFVLAAQIPPAHCVLRFEVTNCKIPCRIVQLCNRFANMQITLDKVSRQWQAGERERERGREYVKECGCASAGQTYTPHTHTHTICCQVVDKDAECSQPEGSPRAKETARNKAYQWGYTLTNHLAKCGRGIGWSR